MDRPAHMRESIGVTLRSRWLRFKAVVIIFIDRLSKKQLKAAAIWAAMGLLVVLLGLFTDPVGDLLGY